MCGGVLFFGMIMHKNLIAILFHFNNLLLSKLTFFMQYSILILDISIIKVCIRSDLITDSITIHLGRIT